MKQCTLGQLRSCRLPPASAGEDDVLASLRRNVDSDHPDNLLLAVPDAMWQLAQSLAPASQSIEDPVEASE
jgi:hypothetical protein